MNKELINEIADLENRIQILRRNYLESNGWHNTSSTPGSYWMWEKQLGSYKILVSERDAWRIQLDLETPAYKDMDSPGV